MTTSPNIQSLLGVTQPYGPFSPGSDALFDAAMAEADAWHREHNAAYDRLWDSAARPLIPVDLFKRMDLSTAVAEADAGMWLTSSGTTGKGATQVHFDATSMARIQAGMIQIFLQASMISMQPARFLLLSPDPREGGHGAELAGYAHSFMRFTACAPQQLEVVFGVDPTGHFDAQRAWETLQAWSKHSEPVFIFGLTVWFEHLALAAPEVPLTMPGPVKGITGGGWKGMTQQLDRPDILQRLRASLQSPHGVDIRDIYGMTEHPLHYLSCTAQRFHLPRYSRSLIMNAQGQPAQAGEQGLIRLQNPFFASLPSHDLLTNDLGVMGHGCECGSDVPWLQFLGRITNNDALCADQALRRAASA